MASSNTGGVKPMTIAGRMVQERERLAGMTDEERAWRKQWLKDLKLHNEPVRVPALEEQFINPIRRFYRAPMDFVENKLALILGYERAQIIRYLTGRMSIFLACGYAFFYYMKYNKNDWTHKSGWRVHISRRAYYPGDPEYPHISDRTKPSDYASRGFKESSI